MTQTDQIRAHLLEGKTLSPLEALNEYGCLRLAARIDELRKEGLSIETITERKNGKAFARYAFRGQARLFI